MASPVRTLVQDFPWVHIGLGLTGNLAFFAGSVLFLPSLEEWKTAGVWLFVAGAGLMCVGSFGALAAKLYERHDKGQPAPGRSRRKA